MNYKKVGFFFSLYMKKNNNTIKKTKREFLISFLFFFLELNLRVKAQMTNRFQTAFQLSDQRPQVL